MPTKKVIPKESTIEDLKTRRIKGIGNDKFEILMYLPNDLVANPQENIGISSVHLLNPELKTLSLYSNSTSIEKVNKTNLLIRFEVAEPYLVKFHQTLLNLPEQVSVKIS